MDNSAALGSARSAHAYAYEKSHQLHCHEGIFEKLAQQQLDKEKFSAILNDYAESKISISQVLQEFDGLAQVKSLTLANRCSLTGVSGVFSVRGSPFRV